MGRIEFLGSQRLTDKDLYVLEVDDLSAWPARLAIMSEHFGLLLLCDATEVPDETILTVAKRAVAQGLAFLSAWGKDSGRVHDLFDDASIEAWNGEQDTVTLTTWNDPDEQPIEEALWHFVYTTRPASGYLDTCRSWIAASVSNAEYAARARGWLNRRRLRKPARQWSEWLN